MAPSLLNRNSVLEFEAPLIEAPAGVETNGSTRTATDPDPALSAKPIACADGRIAWQ
jgi:hypothetical protein